MTKPVVLFFARGYQAEFFPRLLSDQYEAIFVTLTKAEKKLVERAGGRMAGCFEEDYDKIIPAVISEDYLLTSFMSDRFLGRFSYPKRLEILGKEISFWRSILETFRPVAALNELVAIEISEVLLIECRKHDVLYLAGMNCPVENYFYWLNNPLSLSGKHLSESIPGERSTELANRYINDALAKDYRPSYVRKLSGRLDFKPLAAALFKLGWWNYKRLSDSVTGKFRYELYIDEYGKKVSVYFKSLYRSYDRLSELPGDKEVIFFPLHQEPEATLNYMSAFYSNQVATIENILKCLTVNQVLVVKEHPVDKGSLLRKKFWDIKKQYSGLYYIPAEVHGREVMAISKRVVTLTSTVGWEGIIIGKAVYVLGKIFYDNLEGLTKIRHFGELKEILRSQITKERIDIPTISTLVAKITEQSYEGNPFPHSNLFSVANKERIMFAITDAIEKSGVITTGYLHGAK